MTKWLVANTTNVLNGKIEHTVKERPLLHACCNTDHFADVNIDIRPEVNPDFVCDVTKPLPFNKEQFKAGVMDTPWIGKWRWQCHKAIREMLKVCEVVYTINPWVYGWRGVTPECLNVSWRPGINHPILFMKYYKTEKFWNEVDKQDENLSLQAKQSGKVKQI